MIIPTEYSGTRFPDIVLAKRAANGNAGFSTIDDNHAAYMPLHYVLLFPSGQLGWHWALQLQNQNGRRQITRLSQRTFYRFRLYTCLDETLLLFLTPRLFQQYLVDAWASSDKISYPGYVLIRLIFEPMLIMD